MKKLHLIFQSVCLSTRKQKELELSILSGVVQGWEGTDALSLGDAIKIGSVAFGSEHKDRYLMLFSTHLVILSVSQRLSSFIYEVSQWYNLYYYFLNTALKLHLLPLFVHYYYFYMSYRKFPQSDSC